VLVMGFFAAVGEDFVVGENVVLGVAADPGTVRLELEVMLKEGIGSFHTERRRNGSPSSVVRLGGRRGRGLWLRSRIGRGLVSHIWRSRGP
jgi:hypothetical protein